MQNDKLIDIINNLDKIEIEKLNFILTKLDEFTKSDKIDFFKSMIPLALLKIQSIESEKNIKVCENEEHSFGEWEISYLTKYKNEEQFVRYWKRKCNKCQLVDVSSINPDEIEKSKNK